MVSWGVSAQTWIRESAQLLDRQSAQTECGVPEVDAGIYNVPEVLNWIQDSINAFIIQELLTRSSHMRPATGRTQAHCTGVWSDSGSTTWETLCGLQILPVTSLEMQC